MRSMMPSHSRARWLILTGLAQACGAVYAQEQTGPLEEIIVTAEFREANVQETPVAITAVNSEMLDARSQTNIVDVAAQAPNVTLKPADQGSGNAMIAFIRGIGQTDFNYAVEPGVGIYVDDVYYPNLTGSMVDLLDVDRVEILRGPQGTLAGRNSIGGAVKIYSRAPSPDGGGSLSITYGDFDRVDVRASADLTVVDEKLYARVAGASSTRDGYVTRLDYRCVHPESDLPTYIAGGDLSDCEIGTEGGRSFTGGRVFLQWLPSDRVTVDIIGDVIDDESEPVPNVLIRVNEARNNPNLGQPFGIFGDPILTETGQPSYNGADFDGDGLADGTFHDVDGDYTTTDDRVYYSNAFVTSGPFAGDPVVSDPYVSYATYLDPEQPLPNRPFSPVAIPPVTTLQQRGLSVQIDWDITDNLQFESISAFREYDSDWAQDVDASPLNSQNLLQRLEHDHWTQEFRLNGTALDGLLDYTFGAFHVDQDGTLEANVNLYYAQLNFIHGPDPTPSEASALFAHTSWHLSDALNLSVGVRASDESKTYIYRRRNPDGTLPQVCNGPPASVNTFPNCVLAGLFNVSGEFDDSRTDWRLALDWRLTDDVMLYTQAATGFKGGGINPRPFFPIQIESFQPEELTSYEIGAKTLLFDGRVRLNSAVFFNDYTDIQINQTQCEVPPFIDADGLGAPCIQPGNAGDADVEGLEIEAEISLADAWLIDFSFAALDFQYTSLAPNVAVTLDMVTPFTPETTWSFGAQYEARLPGGGTLTPRIDVAYQDEIYTEPLNNPASLIDDYTLTNARLTWRSASDEWEAALAVTNVTDEFYFNNIFEQFDSSGTVSGTPGMPRMWALSLKRNF
ncbi:MAG TPA: TonB-dependent receptor [Gammaproteobacteria bacterium]